MQAPTYLVAEVRSARLGLWPLCLSRLAQLLVDALEPSNNRYDNPGDFDSYVDPGDLDSYQRPFLPCVFDGPSSEQAIGRGQVSRTRTAFGLQFRV